MPATATHAFFAEDVYHKLDSKYQKMIEKDKKSFLMFSQSMDSMMFYNLLNLKKGKKLRKISHIFHTKKINFYFENLIEYIKRNQYYRDSQTLAYLYGLICHYCLDSTIHPYIFYKTGKYNKNQKNTLKYNSLHNYMETFIDNKLIIQRGYNYKKFTFKKLCFDFKTFSEELNDTINFSFKTTYHINNMSQIYYQSLKQMCCILQLFRLDKYGIKKFFYKIIDHITPKKMLKLESISYYHVKDLHDYLNQQKNKWCYPTNQEISSKQDFFELYEEGIEKAVQIIHQINYYFFNNKSIKICKIFQNKSYLTGIDCNKNSNLRYFEF